MELNNLKAIESELTRFTDKLKLAKKRIEEDGSDIGHGNKKLYSGSKETGALKRAALDLKQCLTKNL